MSDTGGGREELIVVEAGTGPASYVGITGSEGLVYSGPCRLLGLQFTNGAAGPSTLQVFDDPTGAGSMMLEWSLPAATSDVRWFGPPGIQMLRGVFVFYTVSPASFAVYLTSDALTRA